MYKYIYKYRVKMKVLQNVCQWMVLITKNDLMTIYALFHIVIKYQFNF